MAYTTYYVSKPQFVVDWNSVDQIIGVQIDWSAVPDSFRDDSFAVTLGAAVEVDDTTATVTALPGDIEAGTVLNFDNDSLIEVTANASAGDTSLTITPHLKGTFTVTLDGGVTTTDTSATVLALPDTVKAGTILDFGAGEYLEVTADAAAGATTLTVSSALANIADTSTATVTGASIPTASVAYIEGSGGKTVEAGTVLSHQATSKAVPRSTVTDATPATCILLSTVHSDGDMSKVGHGAIVGGVIYENLLPDYSNADFATFKTELASAGTGYSWQTYTDNRDS